MIERSNPKGGYTLGLFLIKSPTYKFVLSCMRKQKVQEDFCFARFWGLFTREEFTCKT